MVTANESVGLAREMLELGAFDYVAKPFDFSYLDRAVSAGLLQGGHPLASGASAAPAAPWLALVLAVFRAVRGMAAVARTSTGTRMENAALAVARLGGIGQCPEAGQHLGDLMCPAFAAVESALPSARRALSPAG